MNDMTEIDLSCYEWTDNNPFDEWKVEDRAMMWAMTWVDVWSLQGPRMLHRGKLCIHFT